MGDLLAQFPLYTLAAVSLGLLIVIFRLIGVNLNLAGMLSEALKRQQQAPPPPPPVLLPAAPPVAPPAPPAVQPPVAPPAPVVPPVVSLPPVQMGTVKWPAANEAALNAFYGDPGRNEVEPQLVHIIPPFRMTNEGKPVPYLAIHKKCADALLAALTTVWNYYGQSQAKLDALGISKTAGTYNKRTISGSPNWSNHARGAAIDINAEENGFNVAGNIPRPMVAAFKAQGARWGGDYHGRTDPMHFEFCESGEPRQSFEAWLAHYGVTAPASGLPAGTSPSHGETISGKMSWFGGPEDSGVKPDEGLALCEPSEMAKFPGLFLAEQPLDPKTGERTTGLARRLDPKAHFIAMRWNYKHTPRSWLQGHKVTVTNPANGRTFSDVQPIDWGPAESTGRAADLSKGLADELGLKTDDICQVTIPTTT